MSWTGAVRASNSQCISGHWKSGLTYSLWPLQIKENKVSPCKFKVVVPKIRSVRPGGLWSFPLWNTGWCFGLSTINPYIVQKHIDIFPTPLFQVVNTICSNMRGKIRCIQLLTEGQKCQWDTVFIEMWLVKTCVSRSAKNMPYPNTPNNPIWIVEGGGKSFSFIKQGKGKI